MRENARGRLRRADYVSDEVQMSNENRGETAPFQGAFPRTAQGNRHEAIESSGEGPDKES